MKSTFFHLCLVSIFSVILNIACSTSRQKPIAPPPNFDWQGHRGCRGLLPENSVPAFLKALDFQEITTLELDLAVSKDRQLIVSHEPWFNPSICLLPSGDSIPRRDEEKYLIYNFTADEIRGFDCGSRGNSRFPDQQKMKTHKPTLREVVEAVQKKQAGKKQIRWNIEMKCHPNWDGVRTPPVEDFAKLVVEELKKLGIAEQSNVQSFDVRAVQAVKKIEPKMTVALLIENLKGVDWQIENLGFIPDIYSPYYLVVTQKLVRRCHARGMKIIPWTVNEVAPMRKLIRLGVDGIITDYPDKISQVNQPNH